MCDFGVISGPAIASFLAANAGYIAAGLSAATAVVSGVSAVQQGNQAEKAAKIEAQNQLQIGQIEDSQRRTELRRAMAAQRAQLASSGVTLDSATSLSLGQDAGEQAALEGQAVRANRINQATGLLAEGALARSQGRAKLLGGFASAAGSVLGASSELFSGFGGTGPGQGNPGRASHAARAGF